MSMGRKRLNRVKSRRCAVDVVPKVKAVEAQFCSVCGVSLDVGNRCLYEAGICKSCSDAEYADIEAEGYYEDSLSEAERLAEFLFCSVAEAEQVLAKQRLGSG